MVLQQGQRYEQATLISAYCKELRVAVADLYNALYREGKESKYTYEVANDYINGTIIITFRTSALSPEVALASIVW